MNREAEEFSLLIVMSRLCGAYEGVRQFCLFNQFSAPVWECRWGLSL